MTTSVKLADTGDLLYVRLREGKIAITKAYGDDRLVDLDNDRNVIGVEFIGIDREIDIRGLPAEAILFSVIQEQIPPGLEVLTDLVRA